MALISSILMKYGQTIGTMAMAALIRYLEKTSLIQKYKNQIDTLVNKGTAIVNEANNPPTGK